MSYLELVRNNMIVQNAVTNALTTREGGTISLSNPDADEESNILSYEIQPNKEGFVSHKGFDEVVKRMQQIKEIKVIESEM